MIWNDRLIREWAETGGVTPYAAELVNPASLDLRLGEQIRIPQLFMDMAELPQRDYSQTGRYQGQTGPEAHR